MLRFSGLFLLGLLATACDSGNVSHEMYEAKVKEVDDLQKKLDEVQNGANRRLAEAKKAFDNGEFEHARTVALDLLKIQPYSSEASQARILAERSELAIKAAAANRERARDQALAGMVKRYDDMLHLTIWRARDMPESLRREFWVGSYIILPDKGIPFLHLTIGFRSPECFFIQRYLFKIDGHDYVFTPDMFGDEAVQRDYGGCSEWWDVNAEGERLTVLQALRNAKSAKLRYEGQHYASDHEISAAERAAINRTLVAFEILGKNR